MRAVLDTNVIISGLLSPNSAPAQVMRLWLSGAFELVVSPSLLTELERALRYPKLSARIHATEAESLLYLLSTEGLLFEDSIGLVPVSSRDPDDDYLIALAAASRAMLVSGDGDLLELSEQLPILTPAEFLTRLEEAEAGRG